MKSDPESKIACYIDNKMILSRDILIVDDEIPNLKLLAEYLEQAGYQVRSAEKPQLAIDAALAKPPALILLDVRMPEMDGFEVCRRLKQDKRTRDVPVIFIRELKDVKDKVSGFEAGGVDFISKPFQEEEVLARVKPHLELRTLPFKLNTMVSDRTAQLKKANEALKQEISDRKQAEEALQESEKKLRLLLDSTAEAIYGLDIDGNCTFANTACLRLLGYETADNLVGKNMHNLTLQRNFFLALCD